MIVAAAMLAVSPLTEQQALRLTAKAMEGLDPAAAKGCLAYQVEESSNARFEVAVREVHDSRCGGDPEIMPVIERFRIARRPPAIARYDVVNDRWLACRERAGKPTC